MYKTSVDWLETNQSDIKHKNNSTHQLRLVDRDRACNWPLIVCLYIGLLGLPPGKQINKNQSIHTSRCATIQCALTQKQTTGKVPK